MVTQLTGRIQATDPERAWQWAATIGDESIRRSVQEAVLHHWQTADPAAAARAAAAVRPQ